jgi:hypothetical protein
MDFKFGHNMPLNIVYALKFIWPPPPSLGVITWSQDAICWPQLVLYWLKTIVRAYVTKRMHSNKYFYLPHGLQIRSQHASTHCLRVTICLNLLGLSRRPQDAWHWPHVALYGLPIVVWKSRAECSLWSRYWTYGLQIRSQHASKHCSRVKIYLNPPRCDYTATGHNMLAPIGVIIVGARGPVGKGVGPESERSGVRFPNWSWVETLGKFLILQCLWSPSSDGYLVHESKVGSICAGCACMGCTVPGG